MRVAIVTNSSWNIYNFRMSLVKAFLERGYEVIAIAPEDEYSSKLEEAGCIFCPIDIERKGTNPVKDFMLIGGFYRCFKRTKPDVILNYTIKPNIYGGMAAKLAGIPTINNVSGLGTVFIVKNFISRVALKLYKFAFQFPSKVFFQNIDDQNLFTSSKLVKPEITALLPGSGIDTTRFIPAESFIRNEEFTFLMIARVLYEKGIVEYVDAARIIKEKIPNVKFQLLGFIDESGNIGIKKDKLLEWIDEGIIEYLGTSDDVENVIAKADCVVLPSYREGTPKTLLEAAAMGKPIITTNVPGCKETVVHNLNGLLCEVKNSLDLADKMVEMLQKNDDELQQMGRESRKIAVERFDEKFVVNKYLEAIEEVTAHA